MQRILAATDFSPLGNAAAKRAATLARTKNADFACVHAMPRDALILGAFHEDGGMAEKLRQAGLALSGELSAELSALYGKPVTVRSIEGSAHRVVSEFAEEWQPDLLVMGAHSHGFLAQVFLGGTAAKLLAHSPCATLVVRRVEIKPYATCVAAIDMKERSQEVLQAAQSMGAPRVEVLHAFKAPMEGRLRRHGVSEDHLKRYVEIERERVKEAMTELLEREGMRGAALVQAAVHGHPTVVLPEFISNHEVDIVVVARHSGSRFGESAFGSVPKYLAYNAACDVMIV